MHRCINEEIMHTTLDLQLAASCETIAALAVKYVMKNYRTELTKPQVKLHFLELQHQTTSIK